MPRDIGPYQNVCDWDEASQITGYAVETLRCYHEKKLNIPSVRIAGRVMFIKGELERWMQERAVAHRQHQAVEGALK
jgi:predicted DNA-binding transcriptional regulator AlpA